VSDLAPKVSEGGDRTFRGVDLRTLLVSVTLRCNQSCSHCHVQGSPSRHETIGPAVTVLEQPAHGDLAGLFAELDSGLLASMPCYTDRNVRIVRGDGVPATCIRCSIGCSLLQYPCARPPVPAGRAPAIPLSWRNRRPSCSIAL
jgi:hypothetical protein